LANLIDAAILAIIGKCGRNEVDDMVACSRFSSPASHFLAGFWLGRLAPPPP
jgi:hypothetical protein